LTFASLSARRKDRGETRALGFFLDLTAALAGGMRPAAAIHSFEEAARSLLPQARGGEPVLTSSLGPSGVRLNASRR